MRLRVGVVLCLFLAFLGAGCRKGLAPTVDNNIAPETWITAAPQDTVTIRDALGVPVRPVINKIPVRYHVYWAGSDRDGAIAGFYWAVVETLPLPIAEGFPLPALPGPKARDYHFTTRTDSSFIFTTDENVSEREHAFYIYAVDDKGKPDPTPARFVFRAYDRFPPRPIIDETKGVGTIYPLTPGGLIHKDTTCFVTDSFVIGHSFPKDTVPSGSVLTFKWHGVPTIPGTHVLGYRYKLDEPSYNAADTSVTMVTYNSRIGGDVVAPGVKKFTLRALGQSGWRGESSRFFQMNYAPDEWFAGPDLNDQQWTTYTDGNGKRYWYIDVPAWLSFGGIPNTMLSSDSVNIMPVARTPHRTFMEFYKNRIWGHVEGDTVHINSWVVFPSGGSDLDSPYDVKVGVSPNMPAGPVTTVGPPNGSPIGFRALTFTRKENGARIAPTETTTYPVFDVASVYDSPKISYYEPMGVTGKAYTYTSAEDGDGTIDRRLDQAGGSTGSIAVAEYTGTTDTLKLNARSQVMVFYVNHAPYLKTDDGQFFPKANASYQIGAPAHFVVLADDLDPLDFTKPVLRTGGPQDHVAAVLVRTVDLLGVKANGDSISYNIATSAEFANFDFTVPIDFAPGSAIVRIRLCDYRPSDAALDNFGRCTSPSVDIPITLTAGPVPPVGATGASTTAQGPGSTPAERRRLMP